MYEFKPTRRGPYISKSASSRTDDWPYWYVEGGDGVNALGGTGIGRVFTTRKHAEQLAEEWNG